ncbi:hypothetical protein LTR99_006544 [Exophiala xenobiotica]|uniref:GCS light chain n=1 Tax=Vermiconidia calcicola TaxID=1690605 RepID=A0AAV9Q7R7_9PEZI|nr:hypothetical protein LTR96_007390 [Exophiala xenobiotica]KAK5535652.1 hypothetical protein LTR23_008246 [Chaetothyriales sp. CCFEE 6169]KAK5537714.1 hypothetical protein LTR25_004966 [Vermiconidia calcicola]KAK5301577.1 hypothetical protein LTR99_006544 [Exophiala xenobiotica]KAK5335097.1 hypothetical protein LTR98_008817 [Exophiala xenobiotica]
MKLILSTSNIMSSGQSIVRRPLFSKSNIELINSLRANFASFQHHSSASADSQPLNYKQWTTQDDDSLYVPSWRPTPLSEPRDSYDVTVKLFFLPGIPSSRRCRHTRDAIGLVLKELGIENIDLLIVSFPGVTFDADDEEEVSADEDESAGSDESEGLDAQLKTWEVLESLHEKGVISQLGVSEFSSERLSKFLPEVKVRPTVDQINVKDCCVVPKSLIMYAKENRIELLTHADCMDIMPPGTTRELLGPGRDGAGIIAQHPDAGPAEPGLKGDIEPQWVVKYTAVVKNRGVIENKGYFAVAQLGNCIEEKPVESS